MLKNTQIQSLLNTISAKLKSAASKNRLSDGEDLHECAEWGKLYAKASEHCEEIEVHSDGDFPEKLLGKSFPNETPEEFAYRKSIFQSITKPYWGRAVRSLNRIWSEQNYTIQWNNQDAQDYFTKKLPLYNNILDYFKEVATKDKINDPNAVLVVDLDQPVRETEQGDLEIDDSVAVQPYPTIYCCEDVLMFERGVYGLFMSDENSIVEYNNKKADVGLVMYLYDDKSIYRIAQVGKKIDYIFESELYWQHNLGYLPCWKLKGITSEVIQGELYYESHFAPALPHLNKAIVRDSTLDGSTNKLAYPIRAYYEQSCNNADCHNGKIFGKDNQQVNCPSCAGTGKMRFSPFRDYVHEMPTATNQSGVQDVAFPGITYVSPDSAILEFADKSIRQYVADAFMFLNFDVPNGMKAGLGEKSTATESKIDRDEQFVSVLDISNELYSLLQQFLNASYFIRYLEDSEIVVHPPKTFELISASELTDELTKAKNADMPDIALGELTSQYVIKRFSQNSQIAKIAKIVEYCDPLYTKDAADIVLLKPYYQTWEIVLHLFAYVFIYENMKQNADYLAIDIDTIKTDLTAMAKAKADELPSAINADAIMKQIANPVLP